MIWKNLYWICKGSTVRFSRNLHIISVLKLISQLKINIIVLVQLAELAPCFTATIDQSAERCPDVISEVIFYFRVQQVVAS